MAEIIDKGDRIKVVRDENTITLYDKLDSEGNLQLQVRSVEGIGLEIQHPTGVEIFENFTDVTNPATQSFNELVDAVDDIIRTVFIQENKVLIKTEEDLPEAQGDNIFLVEDTIYQFSGTVDVSKNIVIAKDDLIRGENRVTDGVKFTNGFGFRSASTASRFSMEKMMMSSPTGELLIFNTVDGRIDIRECNIDGNDRVGTITNLGIFNYRDNFVINTITRGLVFDGTNNGIANIKDCLSDSSNAGIAYDFTGTWNIIDVDRLIAFVGPGTTLLKSTPTLTLGKGRVTNCDIINTGGTTTSGFDSTSIDWIFRINLGLEDSHTVGELSFNDNATETTIAAIDTPEIHCFREPGRRRHYRAGYNIPKLSIS